ncbi:MAG TPA: tetratricopeptide repeat protein, partial [Nannocystis sp.]
ASEAAEAPRDSVPAEEAADEVAALDELTAPDEPEQAWPDITDEIEELRFFINGRFEDDAQFTYLELQRRYPGHPALVEFADRFGGGAKLDSAAAPVEIEDVPPPAPPPAPPVIPVQRTKSRPIITSFTDEDDDDSFLSSIFEEPAPTTSRRKTPQRAVATLTEQADAQTYFDLGMAYHEMGLIDDALTQFELAAADPRWQSRAKVMIADLRILRGEPEVALAALREAIDSAVDDAERDAARYRLGEVYITLGDTAAAAAALREVSPGYRDREALLAQCGE